MSTEADSSFQRGFAEYPPNIWADNSFTNLPSFENTDACKHDEMKQEIRSMLLQNTDDPSQKIKLIDIVQRLGIYYHFKTEIEAELSKIFTINHENYNNDLYYVSLRFRLLRQQGMKVSCNLFEKFKDKNGSFKESLSEDVEGMLSLYESAFLGIRGEDILDEAIDFTTKRLKLALPNISPNLAEEVAHALNRPIRKNLPILDARYFIRLYEADKSHNKTLVKFAKLDFNMLQLLHQNELKEILKWWKHWDLKTKLSYVRDRIWELHFWMVGAYFEPQYSVGRKLLTKMGALVTILDDTYDNYAKIEELESLTLAIQRWDLGVIDVLPEYLQIIFQSVISFINEIEEIAAIEGKPFYTYYAKEFMNRAVGSYLIEAKWRDAKYIPTIDEYLAVSTMSTFYPMLTALSIYGMKETATKETFEWVLNKPKSVEASAIICRLMDDIVSHKFEQESRVHVASAVECYVKQYKTSEEEAIKVLRNDVENAWKAINEECFRPLPVASDMLEIVVNLSRVMDVLYKDADGFSNPLLIKDYIASVLKDPIL